MAFGLTILRYQQLVAAPDSLFPETVDQQRLARHLSVLRTYCRVLPLAQALRQLRHGSLPCRAVCLSFDGNCATSLQIALPLLQEAKLHASFFLADPAYESDWRERLADLVRTASGPRLGLARAGLGAVDISTPQRRRQAIVSLTAALNALPLPQRDARLIKLIGRAPSTFRPDHVIALHRAGMHVGARSAAGVPLTSLSHADARAAICHSRLWLEELIQVPVRLFAYPDATPGQPAYAECHTRMLRSAGFDAALDNRTGLARRGHDPYVLPRITIVERTRGAFLLRLASNLLPRV
jgi:peptidoglycan/xylan/chitin deacetylase (PgdA/CDA1 family)